MSKNTNEVKIFIFNKNNSIVGQVMCLHPLKVCATDRKQLKPVMETFNVVNAIAN